MCVKSFPPQVAFALPLLPLRVAATERSPPHLATTDPVPPAASYGLNMERTVLIDSSTHGSSASVIAGSISPSLSYLRSGAPDAPPSSPALTTPPPRETKKMASAADTQMLDELFAAMDANGDGAVSKHELVEFLRQHKVWAC